MTFDSPPPPADERIPYGPDPLQFGDLRRPTEPGPYPVVVMVHGGFWRAQYTLEHAGYLCAALTAQGLATWNLEYRRIGNPGGGWPGTFRDVGTGLDHLRVLALAYDLDLDRVVVIGHSAGGHLALWLAGRHRIPAGDPLHMHGLLPVRGAVSLAGVVDLRRAWELRLSNNVVETFIGGSPADVPERYATASPAELLPLGVRQILIHGTEDEPVPIEISRRYHAAARAKGDDITLVTLQGAGHFEVIDPRSREWPAVERAVLSLV